MPGPVRVAVMISGRGSNMQALHKASLAPSCPFVLCGVLSDHADAGGIGYAEQAGLPVSIVERGAFATKAGHETAMLEAVMEWEAECIALAGFMRILSADFIAGFPGPILNIHPSLLPKFKGLDTHERALDAGETEHGCTVHRVTEELDAGEILAQARVPVLAGDTTDTLAARVLIEEHRLYASALADVLKSLPNGQVQHS